uniref:Phospholysine phosphohistidine inorganic pyrophosphate phosphatase n=1 Tax=Ditylenchus dipsaci TaxID=166011 RepID=A0A915ETL5_9BILA
MEEQEICQGISFGYYRSPVQFQSDGGCAIEGSVEATKRLYSHSKVRFVSNESTSTRTKLTEKLAKLGFDLDPAHIFTPAPVAANYVKANNLRPHLLVHKGIVSEFAGCNLSEPNCVVVGDAEDEFTHPNMNAAFRVLLANKDHFLISLGCGRFYQRVDGPCLDLGGYAMALKYATDCRHVVVGKPEEKYFMTAVTDMGLTKEQVVMIGDDIVSDISAAQNIGIKAIQAVMNIYDSSSEEEELEQTKRSVSAVYLATPTYTMLSSRKVSVYKVRGGKALAVGWAFDCHSARGITYHSAMESPSCRSPILRIEFTSKHSRRCRGPDKASICRIIKHVTCMLNKVLNDQIGWPSTEAGCRRIARDFSGNVLNLYMKIQVLYFTCSWPGSVHDARVLRNSSLKERFDSGYRPFKDAVILGDSAYPTNDWLLAMKAACAPEDSNFYE